MTPRLFVLFVLATCALLAGAGAQSTLHIVEQNGVRDKRINIVFLSEGYAAADLPNFAAHVQTTVNYLFSREPWSRYRRYCNIYRVEIASAQSGTDNGASGGTRNTWFNSGFTTPSVPQLLTFDSEGQSRAYTLLNQHVPEYDIPLLLVNDTKYGGSGGALAVASVNSSSATILEHEIGHSFGGLADEYDIEYAAYTPRESPNATTQTNRSLVKWRAWIEPSTPVPTPETGTYDAPAGVFEGAMYRISGWYRPHLNSVMQSLGRPVGQINREQFVLSYYAAIDPLDTFTPAQTASRAVNGPQQLDFTLTPKVPTGTALQLSWLIDGQPVAGAAGPAFGLLSDRLGNGQHSVSAVVRDATPWVRNDPALSLQSSVLWSFNLSNQLPDTIAGWRAAYGTDSGNFSGDGVSNLTKYALGIDPLRSITTAQRPAVALSTGSPSYLTLSVPRRLRRTDVVYVPEASADLATWSSGPSVTTTVQDTETMLVVRDRVAAGTGLRRYLRLRVQVVGE